MKAKICQRGLSKAFLQEAWFDQYFPQYGDFAGLDGDKDGKPCERLLKAK